MSGVLVALTLCACAPPDHVVVTRTREVSQADPVQPGASHAERFSPQQRQAAPQDEASVTEVLREALEWDVPAGWKELSAGGMRIASLRPAEDPDADCSLILLEGDGGGLVGNVNRWRGQLGLEPLSNSEVDALPRRPLLGTSAVLFDYAGTYRGMGGPEREGWRMLGLIATSESSTLFAKLTGPDELVQAQHQAFLDFCASVRQRADLAAGGDAGAGSGGPGSAGPGPLRYEVPEGWSDEGPASMRAVNLRSGTSQCYVILLGGEAGGLLNNLNRWRGEVGLDPLAEADLTSLDRVPILGREAALLDVRGDYSGMGSGGGANYRVFGVALIRDDVSVFVKMVGPEEELAEQREAFLEFVSSLEEGA